MGMNVSTVWIRVARRIRDAHRLLKLGNNIDANTSNAGFSSLMDSLMGSREVVAA